MWAEPERQNFRSPLKPISVTPDPRSVPRPATFRSRSAPAHQIFGPLRSSSAPLLLQYVSSSKLKKWTNFFYRVSSYDNAVLAVVIKCVCLSVHLSVCLSDTRVLCDKNQTMYCGYFDTTQKDNHPSFLTPTVVAGRRPLRLKFLRSVWLNPSKRADFDRILLITSQL